MQDFDAMAELWEFVIAKEYESRLLKLQAVVVDNAVLSKQKRKEIAEIYFEQLGFETLAILNSAMLSLFSTGKTKGLVADLGEGCTSVVPVYEGYTLQHAALAADFGGKDVTESMLNAVFPGKEATGSTMRNLARSAKERMCVVPASFAQSVYLLCNTQFKAEEEKDPLTETQASLKLPDGKELRVPLVARSHAAELIFTKGMGLTKMVVESIKRCPKYIKTVRLAAWIGIGFIPKHCAGGRNEPDARGEGTT